VVGNRRKIGAHPCFQHIRPNAHWLLPPGYAQVRDLGLYQFSTYVMFVQGFWFGARQVRAGHLSAGNVIAVLWVCLIATSNMQMAILQLFAITKGNLAMAALAATAAPAKGSHKRARSLRKIQPRACVGKLELAGVFFAYPSRPAACVLSNVSLFFAAGDLTFVVGGSGSGKSTVAQLLLHMYAPTPGSVLLNK
jgi:ATP-binding cassette subfamily B (MDR/TAP) protein 1